MHQRLLYQTRVHWNSQVWANGNIYGSNPPGRIFLQKVVTTLRRSQLMTYLKEYCEYCRIGFLLGPLLVPFPSVNSPNMSVVACQSDRPHPLHLKGLLRLFSKWVYNGYISCGVLKQLRTRSKGTKISPQNARLVNYLASSKLSVFPLVCLQVALID